MHLYTLPIAFQSHGLQKSVSLQQVIAVSKINARIVNPHIPTSSVTNKVISVTSPEATAGAKR